jgi:hypothetical protein
VASGNQPGAAAASGSSDARSAQATAGGQSGAAADSRGTASAGTSPATRWTSGSNTSQSGSSGGSSSSKDSPTAAARPDGLLAFGPQSEPRNPPSSRQSDPQDAPQGTWQSNVLRPGEWRETPPSQQPDPDRNKLDKHGKKLADTRGKDWGLPDAARGAVPITRPIRIECEANRLVIAPERGPSGGKVIPMESRTEDSIDEFVSAIWCHMQTWGMAGKGMYWRPVLQVHVAPDAAARFRDLESLLEGSGLHVQQKD